MRNTGSLLVAVGAVLVVVGILLRFAPGLFSWFGNLPGDIDIRTERTRIVAPFGSMLVVSLALSLLLVVWSRIR